ncbi:MAG TPA: hypothetical protein V6D47_18905 [Oscillatoriaceae cyanobacterium]
MTAFAAIAIHLSGCGLFSSLPAGTVTGVVLFNGGPAHGIRVGLQGTSLATSTDLNGNYTFTGVPGGQAVQVTFVSRQDAAAAAANQVPNEVYEWTSAPLQVGSSGASVPPFDISYNGLLYPDDTMALLSGATAPIPFHWSTQLSATHYRLHVVSRADGSDWAGSWNSDPMGIFAQSVTPGKYDWYVEFDGGDRGSGRSYTREVDLSPVDDSSGTGAGGGD